LTEGATRKRAANAKRGRGDTETGRKAAEQPFAASARHPIDASEFGGNGAASKLHAPFIEVHGARQHNLKNIDLKIPRDQLVVITGLSGSGKSSLAFDTLYAEGQRRYVESLSAYARQFLGQME